MSSQFVRLVAPMLLAPLATLALAAPAVAGEPTGEYAVFTQCPLSVPGLTTCVYSATGSGELRIGHHTTPITSPIVFQRGTIYNYTTAEEAWLEAANGETLSHSPQPVPGGLLGIIATESLPLGLGATINKLVGEGLAGVNATTELVGKPTYSFNRLASNEGVGLVLPVRIHLENPALLGSECYIGSSREPVTLKLTTGTTSPPPPNEPISGTHGTIEIRNGGNLIVGRDDSVVDNAFSVPVAHGCGGLLSLVLDPAIDLKLGLPSAAGNNTARLNGSLEQASAIAVKQSGESAAEREAREERERETREREERELREREEAEGF
jgi:hypothetical protein